MLMSNEPDVAVESGESESALQEFIIRPLENMWDKVVEHVPSVATALVVLLGMWIVARILRASVSRVLGMTKLDSALADTRVGAMLKAFAEDFTPSKALAYVVYIGAMLMAWTTATEILGLHAVKETLDAVLGYVPKLVSALLVVALGGYLASVARRSVAAVMSEVRSPFGRTLESLTEGFLLVVVGTVAVDVLGVDVSIVTSNLTVLIGAVLVTLAFLFAWSMRKPAEEIIANYYLRRLVSIGDRVEFGEVSGIVSEFTPIGVVVVDESDQEKFVPARHLLAGLTRNERASPDTVAKLPR
jgi:hypothetical protein